MSKASISTMIRPMREGGMVERLPSANREHHYRLMPGGFTKLLQVQLSRLHTGVEATEFGLSVIGEERAEQRERLAELRDFCRFCTQEIAGDIMARWTDYQAKNTSDQ